MGDMADFINSGLTFSKPRRTSNTPYAASVYAHDVKCPACGGTMSLRNGCYGKFWGCNKFPQCIGSRGVIL